MEPLSAISHGVVVGVAATAVMDVWLLALKRSGVPTMDFALLGRWVGHLFKGTIAHEAIGRAHPIPGEAGLGWLTHYVVGIVFAVLLVALAGKSWLDDPALLPALAWGLATAAAPLFFLQPAMGIGIASSRTAAPLKNTLRSLTNHAVFGLGLYLSAAALSRLTV
ncbi:MAG TPA: DUF2938 family protein [Rubrivivax sp.]|nr:DUF2938 family protein [Rubrivivax sp.]